MEPPSSFVVAPPAGFTPAVGRLVAELEYVWWTTLRTVDGLGVRDLDHRHDPQSNSIGTLLAHIAAVEASHQRLTFGHSPLPAPLVDEPAMLEDLGGRDKWFHVLEDELNHRGQFAGFGSGSRRRDAPRGRRA